MANAKFALGLELLRDDLGDPAQRLESGPTEREKSLLRLCNKLANGQIPEAFPGAQPTSLTSQKVKEHLLREPYLVCEKTDGERHLLLAYEGLVYLIDRRCRFWLCPLQLPLPGGMGYHHNTLLDGELVFDRENQQKEDTEGAAEKQTEASDAGTSKDVRGQWMYLIYDAIAISGQDLTHRTLLHRLRRALLDIVGPKEQLLAQLKPAVKDICKLAVKDFYEIWQMAKVLEISKRLPHATDGLIFTPVLVPYAPGTCPGLLKWKPALLNTVDFKISIVPGDGKRVHVKLLVGYKQGDTWTVKFTGLWLAKSGELFKQLQENQDAFDSMVGECRWNPKAKTFIPADASRFTMDGSWQDGGWVLERLRPDKKLPNDVRTAKRVVESIEDDLSLDDLEREIMQAHESGQLLRAADAGEGELKRAEPLPAAVLHWGRATEHGDQESSKGDSAGKSKGKGKKDSKEKGKSHGKGAKGKSGKQDRNKDKGDRVKKDEKKKSNKEKAEIMAWSKNAIANADKDSDQAEAPAAPPSLPLKNAACDPIASSVAMDCFEDQPSHAEGPQTRASGRGKGRCKAGRSASEDKTATIELQLSGHELLKRRKESTSDSSMTDTNQNQRLDGAQLAKLIGSMADGSQ